MLVNSLILEESLGSILNFFEIQDPTLGLIKKIQKVKPSSPGDGTLFLDLQSSNLIVLIVMYHVLLLILFE